MIPLFKVFMADDVESFVMPVLRSGYIGEGEKVKEFERELSRFIGNDNVIATNSGTSALLMALRLANVTHGSTVISTPQTCLATNTAILSLGARIEWADILPDGTIDPQSVADIVEHSIIPPAAIMCVDWGGTPCRFDELYRENIPLIEDACQSFGSLYKKRHVGSAVDYACFSTQAIKHLTTGDGGALVVNTGIVPYETARLMKWFGLDRTKTASMRCEQDPPVLGHKFQMNDIAASVGLANIRHLPQIIEKTKGHAAEYNQAFAGLTHLGLPPSDPDRESGYWLYTLSVENPADFTAYMNSHGIDVSKAHTRNDTKRLFKAYRRNLPGVTYFDEHHICIPVGWWLTEEDIRRVIDVVMKY